MKGKLSPTLNFLRVISNPDISSQLGSRGTQSCKVFKSDFSKSYCKFEIKNAQVFRRCKRPDVGRH
jgi:hypothetical protein